MDRYSSMRSAQGQLRQHGGDCPPTVGHRVCGPDLRDAGHTGTAMVHVSGFN